MRIFITSLCCLTIGLVAISCKVKRSTIIEVNKNGASTDSVQKNIPERLQKEKFRQYFSNIQNMLNIKPIENGFNGQIIRIWISHGYRAKDTSQLITLIDSAGLTFGNLYSYIPQYSYTWDSTLSREVKVKAITPKTGWKSLMDSIQILEIQTLPDYGKIPEYYLSAGAFGVMIEIATVDKYRIFEYPDYFEHEKTIKQAKVIADMLLLFEREFNIKVL